MTSESQVNRTLLDIIRDDKSLAHKDKKSWKTFRDKLLLRKAGSAWTSTVPTPASDIPIRPQFSRNASVRLSNPGEIPTPRDEYAMIHDAQHRRHHHHNDVKGEHDVSDDDNDDGTADDSAIKQARAKPMISRGMSSRFETSTLPDPAEEPEPNPGNNAGLLPQPLRPQFSRHNSTRMATGRSLSRCESSMVNREDSSNGDQDEPVQRRMTVTFVDDRHTMSAREAAAAQEAADAKREGQEGSEEDENDDENEEGGGGQAVRMSLMDLLAETDREMGLEGARYMVGDDEEEEEEEEMEEEEDEDEGGNEESNCCVCHVRHKGAASVPCGHTYCRLCSKELCVTRDHCPLCNDYIQEILDVF